MAANIITKFVLGQFAKRSARKSEGIATLLKASDPVVQSNAKNIEIILKNMGIDPKSLKSTDDVLKHMNIHKSLMNQSLKQEFKGLDLDKGIKSLEKKPTTESLLKGEKYTDERGRTWDFGTKDRPYPGWKPEIVKTKPEDKKIPMFERHQKEIKDVDTESAGMGFYSEMSDLMKRQRLEELELDYDTMFNKILEKAKRIDADPKVLLEAELGKKLTGKETTTQLLEIFKNRPKKASGGRIGMLMGGFTKAQVLIQMLKNTIKGSKDPYVKKTFPKWIKEIQANPSLANNENVWKNLTTGLPKNQRLIVHSDDSVDFFTQTEFGPHNIEKTLEFQKKHNLSREQANTILKMEPEDRVLEMKRLETIRNKTMQAEGGRIGMMYGGDPGFAFEYGGSWADWHDQHRDQMPVEQYIKTKLPKHRLPFRELQSGGLAYMLGEPTYSIGGSVGHAPWHKPTGQKPPSGPEETPPPQVVGTPDPLKAPRGIPSLAPKNMDPAYMQQQMMQQAMMGRGRPMANEGGRIGFEEGHKVPEEFLEHLKRKNLHKLLEEHRRWKEDYERRKDLAPTQEAAEGGRIGFDKGGYWSKLKKKYKGSTLQAMLDNPQLMAAELGHEGVFSLLQMLGMKEGGRARFDKGKKVDLSKRRFLKGTGAAVGLLSMLPFVGKFFKAAKVAKPAAAVTETIVKSNAAGMPAWFPSLVKRVLKEGEDVGKAAGAMERQTVHKIKLPESGTPVEVMHDLTSGDVIVDIGMGKHGWSSGFHGQPTRLVLKKGEWIEPTKGKKGIKTKDEFSVEEAEFTGGHPENIKFEDVTIEKYGQHGSDFTEVEKYATGKTSKGSKAQKEVWEADWDDSLPDDMEYASGGLAYLLGE